MSTLTDLIAEALPLRPGQSRREHADTAVRLAAVVADWLESEPRTVDARTMLDHERCQGGCRCGAGLGDRIDADWHLANQATAAKVTALAAEARKGAGQ